MRGLQLRKGMTLVEMMVAIAITSVILAMSTSIFVTQYGSYYRGKNVKDAQQSGQEALALIKTDLMEAGWLVQSRSAFYFQDGGANGSDMIVVSDSGVISLIQDVVKARNLLMNIDYPGSVKITTGSGSSNITVEDLDLNDDTNDDFKGGGSNYQFVISDGTVYSQKAARIGSVTGLQLSLLNFTGTVGNLTGTRVSPAIFYCVNDGAANGCDTNTATRYMLHRSDRASGGRQPMAENVVDLQVAYKDGNDVACQAFGTQAACDAAAGCGWLSGRCTGYWYGKSGCAGQGAGAGFCTLSPFDPSTVTLIRVTVVTRGRPELVDGDVNREKLVDPTRNNPTYCRPAVENHLGAAVGSTDCGYIYRTYTTIVQPRNNRNN